MICTNISFRRCTILLLIFLTIAVIVITCNSYEDLQNILLKYDDESSFERTIDDYKKIYNEDTLMCYDVHHEAAHFAGTFTPYKAVANLTAVPYRFPGCHPVKIWLLLRHGSRTPHKKKIKDVQHLLPHFRHHILYNHMMGKGELNDETIAMFKKWAWKLPDKVKMLTQVGESEMFNLARRYKSRFPWLIPGEYSTLQHQFRHTLSKRTKSSAYNFAKGLFGSETADEVEFVDTFEDHFILKSHAFCRKWKKKVNKNPQTFDSLERFTKRAEMAESLISISYRLGLNTTLTYDEASAFLFTCAAEIAWDNADSPWCHIFSKKDLEVLEYAYDVQKYYQSGFGNEINYKQSCPIINDMISYLIEDSSWPPAQFLFSHSGTIVKFIAALGLYKDDGHLSYKFKRDRKWRMSKIDPFATNFASVLYRCDDKVDKVLMLHQEEPVVQPACGNIFCPLKSVVRNYNEYYECDFDRICRNKKKPQFTDEELESILNDIVL